MCFKTKNHLKKNLRNKVNKMILKIYRMTSCKYVCHGGCDYKIEVQNEPVDTLLQPYDDDESFDDEHGTEKRPYLTARTR